MYRQTLDTIINNNEGKEEMLNILVWCPYPLSLSSILESWWCILHTIKVAMFFPNLKLSFTLLDSNLYFGLQTLLVYFVSWIQTILIFNAIYDLSFKISFFNFLSKMTVLVPAVS